MRRYSPGNYSPQRRGYGGRGRSPPRRGYGGRKDQNNGSLLVRNIPLNFRAEDLRVAFERYGPVRDVYIPKDYYSGEPRGFAFVQYVDPYDASEAQYHMNRKIFCGREITVVVASETRKRPEEMRRRARVRGSAGYDGGRSSYYGRPGSRSISRSRSPRYPSDVRTSHRSRSYSPSQRRRKDGYSASPSRQSDGNNRKQQADREGFSASPRERPSRRSRSPVDDYRGERGEDQRRISHSPKSE